jgi:hypothetical protein
MRAGASYSGTMYLRALYDLRRFRSKTTAAKTLGFSVRWQRFRASYCRKVAPDVLTDGGHEENYTREPIVSTYRPPVSPERQAAIDRAVALMRRGLPWRKRLPPFTREQMHER